jgi:hypothetical protein
VHKRIVSVALVMAGLGVALQAGAAPRGGGRSDANDGDPPAAAHRPVLRGRFAGRLAEKVQKPGKAAKTRGEIVAMFDANTSAKLHNGKTVTVQQLLDSLDDAEGDAQKKGGSLRQFKKDTWMKADTPTVISAQKVEADQDLKKLLAARAALDGLRPGAKGAAGGAAPSAAQQNQVSWNKKLGDAKIVAAYTDFRASEQTPNATTASCNVTWDNGVHLLGEQKSLVKFVVETKTTSGSSPSASAKGSLYVIGSASPTWQKSGKFDETLDRTFSVKKGMDYTIIPGIYLNGSIAASSTLSLKPGVDSTASATQAYCGISATPGLRVDLAPEVSLNVGIPKVADIIEGGLKANIALVDAKIPTTMSVSLGASKMQVAQTGGTNPVNVRFKSDLDVTFMRGELKGWYKIDDICAWGYCLIEDGLGIDTSGEVKLWQGEGYPYKVSLIDIKPAAGNGISLGGAAPMAAQ